MFENVEEIKQFIVWAKSQGLKSVSIDNVKFEISDVTLADEFLNKAPENDQSPAFNKQDWLAEQSDPNEDEDLLYHSAR